MEPENKTIEIKKNNYANIKVFYINGEIEQYEFIRFNSIGQMSDNPSLMTFSDDDVIYILNTNEIIRVRIDMIKEVENGESEEA